MSRIAIMVRLANGGSQNSGAQDGSPSTHPTLGAARAELEDHLREAELASAMGHLDGEHSVADYYLHDTATDDAYDVAWGPGKSALLVRVSHAAVLKVLADAVAEGKAENELAFELDAAQTVLRYGMEDHRRTQVVLLPPQDGPNWDKHVIAPSSMLAHEALAAVNEVSARANAAQARIELGFVDDDGMKLGERIEEYLGEAGFVTLSQDEGNMRIADCWEQDPTLEEVQDDSPVPGL
ncbi:hypothetical protein [Massilia alkalitolerans]|uniref:hypothetical protein n=1 Tax=Massilia alkalitolerans TaxID=286638 RepID=UPI000485CAAE|nr:hypothetical protein [Massilia alkalitolerans]